MRAWQPIAEGLWRFEDCVNVYALVDGTRALLIDLGSGAGLARLPDIGVETVEAVWFTHAHADQCQGWAQAAGIPLHFAPAAAAHLDRAQRLDYALPSPCHIRYPWPFRISPPIPGAVYDLSPGREVAFGPFDLAIVAAPGHCDHQIAILAEGPAGIALLCGDAIHSLGCVHEGYHLENDHYTGAGTRLAADTLCALRNLRADWLCPSHGPVTCREVDCALTVTIARLYRLADLRDTNLAGRPAVRRLVRSRPGQFVQVSDHLWLCDNSYFLRSDDGPVLLVDADVSPERWQAGYREVFGEQPIEVVLVSHAHCDHVMGIEPLRAAHPLACWAHESLLDVIEQPYAFARPWMHDSPTKVDRPLAEAVPVRWREYELTPYWFPAQTDLHAAYSLIIDGHRALFAGDNFYPAQQWGGTGGLSAFNGGQPRLWRRSAELVLSLAPDWILASHRQPYPFRREDFEEVVAWSYEAEALLADLSPDDALGRHHNPHLIEARPYVQPAATAREVALICRNPSDGPMALTVTPVGIRGVTQTVTIAPGEQTRLTWPVDCAHLSGVLMVTFDVVVNGEHWGQSTECYLRGPG
ncbi:MAG: MBL fold metallo-hydrolase [Armatimonadetes bacterium]|nr:MBL fold metallo-hydrolase [Armatimonadota bacterium]